MTILGMVFLLLWSPSIEASRCPRILKNTAEGSANLVRTIPQKTREVASGMRDYGQGVWRSPFFLGSVFRVSTRRSRLRGWGYWNPQNYIRFTSRRLTHTIPALQSRYFQSELELNRVASFIASSLLIMAGNNLIEEQSGVDVLETVDPITWYDKSTDFFSKRKTRKQLKERLLLDPRFIETRLRWESERMTLEEALNELDYFYEEQTFLFEQILPLKKEKYWNQDWDYEEIFIEWKKLEANPDYKLQGQAADFKLKLSVIDNEALLWVLGFLRPDLKTFLQKTFQVSTTFPDNFLEDSPQNLERMNRLLDLRVEELIASEFVWAEHERVKKKIENECSAAWKNQKKKMEKLDSWKILQAKNLGLEEQTRGLLLGLHFELRYELWEDWGLLLTASDGSFVPKTRFLGYLRSRYPQKGGGALDALFSP